METTNHEIKQGECISSIAERNGLHWKTIWEHSDNKDLKEKRKNPNVLLPGDLLYVPEIQLKTESVPTDNRQKFVRKGVPSKLKLRLMKQDKPRANMRYVLNIDGNLYDGKTDGDGNIFLDIPPGSRDGKLILYAGKKKETYKINIGHLNPGDNISGIQQRLANLGISCKITNINDVQTGEAIARFQEWVNLPITSNVDEDTRKELIKRHGS